MRREPLFVAALVLTATVPSVAGAHHRPDHMGGPDGGGGGGTTGPLTLTASPNPVVYGGTTVVSAG
jgi:hypothetical protein